MSRQFATVFLLFAGVLQAQSLLLQSGSHFGLNLSPEVLALWNEVANGYGKPIREGSIDFAKTGSYGFSDVDSDGTPYIALSERGQYEENIVHELMHLDLAFRGYPREISWTFYCPADKRITEWLPGNLKDVIEHWIFYPRVLALGITPDPELRRDIEQAIQRDYFAVGDNLSKQDLATYYFRALTLPNNADLPDKVSAWYKRKGWTQAMELGDQMFRILSDVRPASPEQEITVFLASANALFKEEGISFRENGWTSLTRGTVVLRGVRIEIARSTPCPLLSLNGGHTYNPRATRPRQRYPGSRSI
jgi:hypothetical protein